MSELHLIAAQTLNHVIGRNNGMPWHLPRDLQHFKATTSGHPVIMGRKTYESLGKALPNRRNHVVSRQTVQNYLDAQTHQSLAQAIHACQHAEKIFIIGGGTLYRGAMPLADELNITWINTHINGDTTFPEIDLKQWKIIEEQYVAADEKNIYDLTFTRYRKRDT